MLHLILRELPGNQNAYYNAFAYMEGGLPTAYAMRRNSATPVTQNCCDNNQCFLVMAYCLNVNQVVVGLNLE